MASSFLERVARSILDRYPDKLETHTIILPSDRAAAELARAFGRVGQKAMFLPKIVSLSLWIDEVHNARKVDKEEATLLLFRAVNQSTTISLSEFQAWGSDALNDFNDIYRSLKSPEEIFTNLRQVKELEEWEPDTWSFEETDLGESQKKFIRFWEQLPVFFHHFDGLLQESGLATSAKMERDIAKNQHLAELFQQPHHFAGFNVLSPAEMHIMKTALKAGNTSFYWDYNEHMLSEGQEAGFFLRRNMEVLGRGELPADSNYNEKRMHVISAQGDAYQCAQAGQLVAAMSETERQRCGLILADESLTDLLINFLPDIPEGYNFSMGYPLKHTPEYALILHYCQMQQHAQSAGNGMLYSNDVRSFMLNELMPRQADHTIPGFRFLSRKKLKEILPPAIESCAEEPVDGLSLLGMVHKLITWLDTDKYDQRRPAFSVLLELIESCTKLVEKYPEINTVKDTFSMLRKKAGKASIDLKGDKQLGVQVMGVLESRLLDFDRIIFLSLNEGIMPATNRAGSLIPFDLRKHFSLPTFKEREFVYAYNFYRLLKHPQASWLIYNGSETQDLSIGEKSRYLLQIDHELKDTASIAHHEFGGLINLSQQEENAIEKTPFIMERLHVLAENGFSPSALAAYINCPVSFYYKYVLGFEEPKDVDDVSDDKFGVIVHETLEALYTPFLGEMLHVDQVKSLRMKAKDTLAEVFERKTGARFPLKGKMLLNFDVAFKYVDRALEWDLHETVSGSVRLHALEARLEDSLPVTLSDGTIKEVKIKGNADRIDQKRGTFRIIDYKTGYADQNDLKIKDTLLMFEDAKKQKQLQLLWYASIFLRTSNQSEVQSSILSLRKIKSGLMHASINKQHLLTDAHLEEFRSLLSNKIAEIMDPEIPFVRNPLAAYDTIF